MKGFVIKFMFQSKMLEKKSQIQNKTPLSISIYFYLFKLLPPNSYF